MPRTNLPWYPPPGPDLRDADEDQVVRWIGGWLMEAAPEGWLRIDMTVRVASTIEETTLAAVMPGGGPARMEPPPDVSPLLFELRQKKYMPGRGTWLSMRLVIEPDGAYRVQYNFDLDPQWDPPVETADFDDEFVSFPREDEWIPAWYREELKGETGGKRTPDEPNALLENIANVLKFALPAGWDSVRLQYRAIGDHEESGAIVHSITGTVHPWTPPERMLESLRRHRAASVSDDRGTWVSLTYEMSFPETVKATFNTTEDPDFRQRPPAEAFAEELRRYPRSDRRTPDWLRQGAETAEGSGDSERTKGSESTGGSESLITPPSPDPLDPDQQQEIVQQIATALTSHLPPGWQQLRAEYRAAGRHVEAELLVTEPTEESRRLRPDPEAVRLFGVLRSGMYQPGLGTWLSATLVIEPGQAPNAEFVPPDREPRFRQPPLPIAFQNELRFFPRADEHVPAWLREKAALEPHVPDGETPPRIP